MSRPERVVRAKAKEDLEDKGWVVWCAPHVKFKVESDIFGVADAIAVKGSRLRLIQWTTDHNFSARVKKVQRWKKEMKVSVTVEVWGLREDGTWRLEGH